MASTEIESVDEQDRGRIALIPGGGRQREEAVEALFRKYRRPLLAFLMRRGLDGPTAEDAVQEVFVRVVKGAGEFRQDAKVSTWIFQIAKNLHIDMIRKARPEQTVDDEEWREIEANMAAEAPQGAGTASADALRDCVDRAYRAFAAAFPVAAEALDKVVRFGWSTRDLAAFLQRTEGATREFLSKARKKLRRYAEHCHEFLSEP